MPGVRKRRAWKWLAWNAAILFCEIWGVHRKNSNTAGTAAQSATIFIVTCLILPGGLRPIDASRRWWHPIDASRRWALRAQHYLWSTARASPSSYVCRRSVINRSKHSLTWIWLSRAALCVSDAYLAPVAPWEDYEVHSISYRPSVGKSLAGVRVDVCRNVRGISKVPVRCCIVEAMDLWLLHSSQLIVMCQSWSRRGCMSWSGRGEGRQRV